MSKLFLFIYRKSENDAVNRFFAPYFEAEPRIDLSWVNADNWVLAGDVPDPWNMTDEERKEFIEEARNTFVSSIFTIHHELENNMGEAFATALDAALDYRLREGIADDGTMHITPSKSDASDYERALEKALEQFEEEATVHFTEEQLPEMREQFEEEATTHFKEIELPEMREQFEEDFRCEWEARSS